MDIGSLEYTIATSIDGETVLIEDIIIFEDMLAYVEVAAFDLLLYCGDISHQSLGLDEGIVFRM